MTEQFEDAPQVDVPATEESISGSTEGVSATEGESSPMVRSPETPTEGESYSTEGV